MIADSDIDRARVRVDVIAAEVPMKRVGRELAGCCPFHQEKTPSFYVIPDKGFWHCFGCGAHGDAIGYVMRTRGLAFADAVHEINGTAPCAPQKITQNITRSIEPRPDAVVEARAIWAAASAEHRSRVELYLWSRYLRRAIPPTIREHPCLYCSERHAELPALVAAFKDSNGYISAVQRIWLGSSYAMDAEHLGGDPHGSRLAGTAKRTRGEMRDGCVRLAPAAHRMGLAEGIETALAAAQLFKMPVWATCGSNRLPTVWIPPECTELWIFADRGTTGEEWAAKAVDAHSQHRPVGLRLPADGFDDFSDELRAKMLSGAVR